LTEEDYKDHPNQIVIYDNWDRSVKYFVDRSKFQYYHIFNPDPEVILSEVNECPENIKESDWLKISPAERWQMYKGQVLYFNLKKTRSYIQSPFSSVLTDMQTEGECSVFKNRNVTTNFMASHIMFMQKPQDSGIDNSSPQVNYDTDENPIQGFGYSGASFEKTRNLSKEQENILNQLEQFQGADDALKLLALFIDDIENPPKIEKVDIQNVEGLFQFTEQSVRGNIIRSRPGLSEILVNVAQSGKLGQTKEMKDAANFFNAGTRDERIALQQLFELLDSNFVTKLNPSGDYTIIPLSFELNIEDLPPTFIAALANPAVDNEMKRGFLRTFLSWSEEKINNCIPLNIPEPINPKINGNS
jgi:hypothetical protein